MTDVLIDSLQNIREGTEFELRVGMYAKKGYTSLISQTAFQKMLNSSELFDTSSMPEYSLTKVEDCGRGIRKVSTFYKGDKLNKLKPNSNTMPKIHYEIKRQYRQFFIKNTGIKASFSTETGINKIPKVQCRRIRFRQRISKIGTFNTWRYDFSVVYFGEMGATIKNIKNLVPAYSLELECIDFDPKKITKSLLTILPVIKKCVPETIVPEAVDVVNSMLKLFKKRTPFMRKFILGKNYNTINMHKLMTQVIALDKNNFNKIFKNYAVTAKTDGVRSFIYINEEGNIFQIFKTKEVVDLKIKIKQTELHSSILDCEFVETISTYFLFDILVKNGTDLTLDELPSRMGALKTFEDLDLGKIKFKIKQQNIPTETASIFQLSDTVFHAQYPYKIDGLIFTPIREGYHAAVYKWKPSSLNTIDFLLKKDKKNHYLFVGIPYQIFKRCGFKLDTTYKKLFPKFMKRIEKHEIRYFPFYFMPRSAPQTYKLNISNNLKDNVIVELSYDLNKKEWIFHRYREDKTKLYETALDEDRFDGPNSWNTALRTWNLIFNPVTEEMMFKTENTKNYYTGTNTGQMDLIRKFHNFVKKYLYDKYIQGGTVLEIAGGRGGDLWKLANRKVEFTLLTDVSEGALEEAERRYKEMLKRGVKMEVKFLSADFTKNVTKKIETTLLPLKEVDYVNCHFAFHYFLKNKTSLENIFSNINTFLKKGGYFIFTALDGAVINERLKTSNKISINKNGREIISIKKLYKNNKLKNLGQEVDVYTESIGAHKEYLVNYEYIINFFETNGYKLIESENFSSKFNNNSFKSKLEEKNIEFSSLNRYVVLQKAV